MKPTDARSAYRLQRILEHLADHDHTRAELAAVMHVTRSQSLAGYLAYLVGMRLAHILRWTEPGPNGRRQAVYRWGRGRNAKHPPRKPHAQIMRDYNARKKTLALVE